MHLTTTCHAMQTGPALPQPPSQGPAGGYEEDYHGRVSLHYAGASGELPGTSQNPLHEFWHVNVYGELSSPPAPFRPVPLAGPPQDGRAKLLTLTVGPCRLLGPAVRITPPCAARTSTDWQLDAVRPRRQRCQAGPSSFVFFVAFCPVGCDSAHHLSVGRGASPREEVGVVDQVEELREVHPKYHCLSLFRFAAVYCKLVTVRIETSYLFRRNRR